MSKSFKKLGIIKKSTIKLGIVVLVVAVTSIAWPYFKDAFVSTTTETIAAIAIIVSSPFNYNFSVDGTLNETGTMNESTSPYWWVNSGAIMRIQSKMGMTIQNSLPESDKWRKEYGISNPIDTDNGYHPQNIFRLVSRNTWHNLRQEMYFMVNRDQLSASPNRNESNGLLLFNRYVDGNNLYYTGVRVDGTIVIKKKIAGIYYTLAQKPIFPGRYNRVTNPDLIPKNTWIGIRSEVTTTSSRTVDVKVYTDIGRTGSWTLALQATDNGVLYGPINDQKAFVGIRTDFMDVQFNGYRIEELR